jgi:hypothetical protein
MLDKCNFFLQILRKVLHCELLDDFALVLVLSPHIIQVESHTIKNKFSVVIEKGSDWAIV